MKKNTSAVSVIGGADGPTSVFILGNAKPTLRQKLQRLRYQIKRLVVEKTLKCESHSMDEVMAYLVDRYGFVEVDPESNEVAEEYRQMRASFLIQFAPELLGEDAARPQLKSESPEDVEAYFKQVDERIKRASEIPPAVFDIDFHKFKKTFDDLNDNMDIMIEKKFDYIGGGAAGNKKLMRQFHRIYKNVYRYYGVTKEDQKTGSKRYEDVVRTLSL